MTRYKTNETGIDIGDAIELNDEVTAVKIAPFLFLLIKCHYSYRVGRLYAHDEFSQYWFSSFDKLLKYE